MTRAQGTFATVEWDAYVRASTHHIDLLTPLGEPMASEKHFTGRNGIDLGIITMSAPAGHFGIDVDDVGMQIPDELAPALALAILEAAGVEPLASPDAMPGTPGHVRDIAHSLRGYIRQRDEATKEAADQKELETEALTLCRVMWDNPNQQWEPMSPKAKTTWLAMASTAREMHNR